MTQAASASATASYQSIVASVRPSIPWPARWAARAPLGVVLSALFVAALPDAMIPPVLKGLLVDRYGVSSDAAHWFMAVNLIGAVLATPWLAWCRRRWSPGVLLSAAAAANGLLLLTLAAPIGFAATLGVRTLEGAADIMVIAILFDVISKAGPAERRGRRFGMAGGVLLFALACGAIAGGVIGGGAHPTAVLLFGGVAACAIAGLALVFRHLVDGLVRYCPAVAPDMGAFDQRGPIWPALLMQGSDRAIGGVMATTVSLFLAESRGLDATWIGGLLGVSLLAMAILSWPAGKLGDRIGAARLRLISATLYAIAFAAFGAAWASGPVLFGAALITGAAGAALLPTALVIGARAGQGAVGMSRIHAAGSIGFFVGIVGAGVLATALTGAGWSDAAALQAVIFLFAGGHLVSTGAALLGVRRTAT